MAPQPRTGRSDPCHVLVVDDDRMWRELLDEQLTAAGYHVLAAASGRDAIAAMESDHVEVVILDVEMPGMDGWQVRRWMRAQPKLALLPAIVLSSFPPRVAPEPVDAMLQKSTSLRELVAVVDRLAV